MKFKNGQSRNSMGRKKEGVLFPVASPVEPVPDNYAAFLAALKHRISQERLKAVIAINAALVQLYWDIGKSILEKQNKAGWGAKVIDRLSSDLRKEFPNMQGFSPRNMKCAALIGQSMATD